MVYGQNIFDQPAKKKIVYYISACIFDYPYINAARVTLRLPSNMICAGDIETIFPQTFLRNTTLHESSSFYSVVDIKISKHKFEKYYDKSLTRTGSTLGKDI